ncbi:MAG: recG [Gammaproteobacteria bacterium]|nr:recG [Gammaproteobacteria bacterium]
MTFKQSTIDLSTFPCQHLKGVGQRVAEHLARLEIHHVQDLLFHLPFRYQDRTRIYPISDISPGDMTVIEGEVMSVTVPTAGRTRLLCRLEDKTGRVHLRFFYLNNLQIKSLKTGMRLRCFGEVRWGKYGLEMIHPEYRLISEEITIPIEKNLTPIYPTTEGLSQLMWRKLTAQALHLLTEGGVLQDILPISILEKFTFPSLKEALCFIHRPPADAPLDLLLEGKHISQKRLVFEELLAHRLSLLNLKNLFQIQKAIPLPKSSILIRKFLSLLSFQLTTAQKKVIEEISQDLCCANPMLRLVQGDVGSGKTVVAAFAILQAVEQGCQAALLAPTELLVEQHHQTFQKWFEPLGIKVVMLAGRVKTALRCEVLNDIATGQAQVVIGTQAIFQKGIEFSKLALIIVDEQHRFGVQQRALLREKGIYNHFYPHQLIMTATPIPRTLAMSVYADLDYSVIDELPPGRTPVITRVISNDRRDDVLMRIREACKSGRQAYWVCTLIEESETLQCQTAEETATMLQTVLPELKIALLHGRMKSMDKEQIMQAFKKGEIHLLVATTVIEVGVDVPKASLMVIENAERLGLAQLHQLRGRVGRGAIESHCLLLYQAPISQLAKARLAVMRETTDGFKIAQRDLELRGPGEVLGTKQTGDISMRIADLMRDSDLFPTVQQAASIFLQDYKELVTPLIKRWLRNSERYGQV